jgi:hypothetical protein
MSKKVHPEQLQSMIDRAGRLTAEEAAALGGYWKADEDIAFPEPSIALGVVGEVSYPVVTNADIVTAWDNALDGAGKAGRVDEIEAATEAGRATKRDVRHMHDDELEKDGAEEAVRAAVLATGVRDLISDEDYRTLTAAWSRTLGDPTA